MSFRGRILQYNSGCMLKYQPALKVLSFLSICQYIIFNAVERTNQKLLRGSSFNDRRRREVRQSSRRERNWGRLFDSHLFNHLLVIIRPIFVAVNFLAAALPSMR